MKVVTEVDNWDVQSIYFDHDAESFSIFSVKDSILYSQVIKSKYEIIEMIYQFALKFNIN